MIFKPRITAQKAPVASTILALLELPRMFVEIGILRATKPLLSGMPKGDGHSVIVIPGFLGSDNYNKPLCEYLNGLGYDAQGWMLGVNLGPRDEILQGLERLLVAKFQETGCKVSIIGHSLGGIYAREIAKLHPEKVRQVISLGSPIAERAESQKLSAKLFRRLNVSVDNSTRYDLQKAPPVPTTAVFTRADGVVHWRNSIQKDGHEFCQNVEVFGSHSGMTMNTSVWRLLADRLALPEADWKPFKLTGLQRTMYPIFCQKSLKSM